MKTSKLLLLGMLVAALFATAPVMAAAIRMEKETEIKIGDPDHPVDVYWIGQTIHFTLEIENTSKTAQNMTIDIYDIEPGGSPTVQLEDDITLTPGQVWSSGYDYVIVEGDVIPHPTLPGINIVINTLHAYGSQGVDLVDVRVTKTPQVVNPQIHIEKATNGADADAPTGPFIPVGDAVTWTYVVTNPGDVPLTGIVVTDDQGGVTPLYTGGDINTDNILQVTETWTYQASGTAAAGQYANIGTATGHYYGRTVNDTDPSHYFGANPVIHIEKDTNGDDADDPTGPEISVGGAVTWTYVVTNLGNVPLSDIAVTDNQGVTPLYTGGDINTDNILQVTETWTYQATGTAAEGQYANIGTAEGDYDNTTVSDTDPSHYIGTLDNPGIDIEKYTNDEDADDPYGPFIMVGDTVTWTYVVTNTGNVDLTGVVVIDDNGTPGDTSPATDDDFSPSYVSGDGGVAGVLEVGEVWTYEWTGTATAEQYENWACVDALFRDTPVGDCDPSHYYGVVCYSETAFGLGNSSACFIDLDNKLKANRWGWTHGPLAAGGTYTFDLWAGAAHCETDNGTYAGTVTIHYTGAGADITYNLEPDFEIVEEHLYIGGTQLPQVTKGKKTEPTVAPGQYYITNGLTGNIYIIYHSVVQWCDYPVELVQ